MIINLLLVALGVLLLTTGGEALIRGSLAAANKMGVSPLLSGLLIVGFGTSALLQPLPVHSRILQFDQWIMLGAALILLLFLYTGKRLTRFEGALLLLGYAAYVGLSFTVFNG